jgi:hypothetical protein
MQQDPQETFEHIIRWVYLRPAMIFPYFSIFLYTHW